MMCPGAVPSMAKFSRPFKFVCPPPSWLALAASRNPLCSCTAEGTSAVKQLSHVGVHLSEDSQRFAITAGPTVPNTDTILANALSKYAGAGAPMLLESAEAPKTSAAGQN